jgi:alkylated DNA repair dioxygenase AlkB
MQMRVTGHRPRYARAQRGARVHGGRTTATLGAMQPTALPLNCACESLDLVDAEVRWWPQALPCERADALFDSLRTTIAWEQEEVLIFGARRRVPRLVAWHGDPGTSYVYSGTRHEPRRWTPTLLEIRDLAERLTGHRYNSVLLNRYRDGNDGMGWHADDEPVLGRNPAIASVSLGATRRFKLRHRRRDSVVTLDLQHGGLLLMAGPTQHHYVHAVPKTARLVGERINLTFRLVTISPGCDRDVLARSPSDG